MKWIIGFCLVLPALTNLAFAEEKASFPADAEHGLRKALQAVSERQTHGGWGRAYTLDGKIMWGEYRPIPADWIVVQPPTTPTIAGIYLRAARLLNDPAYAAIALRARDTLLKIQSPAGGFPHEACPDAPPPQSATFDDDTTTSALDFFIDWWQYTGKEEDRAAVDRVGAFLIQAQYPQSGGWPQYYPPSLKGYNRCITFNDNVMRNVMRALLRLHQVTGDTRYLETARKGGECILRLQGGVGEAIWAQQYDPDTLQPAWARKFEPPGYAAGESIGVCDTLIDLYLATGENRFLEPLPKAFEWYDTHRLANGKLARLYEPGTQRPVYGRRDIAQPVYEFENACSGYSWQADWYPSDAKQAYQRIQAVGRVAFALERAKHRPPATAQSLEKSAQRACETLSSDGLWVRAPDKSDLEEYAQANVPPSTPMVKMDLFVHHATAIMDYLEAVQRENKPAH